MRRYARLGEAQHGGKFGDSEFLALKQRKQAHARRVRKQPEQRRSRSEIQYLSFHLD
jgi:hypothetical protein